MGLKYSSRDPCKDIKSALGIKDIIKAKLAYISLRNAIERKYIAW